MLSIFKRLSLQYARPPHQGQYRCKYCSFTNTSKQVMGQHYDTKHRNMFPDTMDGYRWFYYLMTGKDHGSCVMCKGLTEFNRGSMKYSRFCVRPECIDEYREEFKRRMIGRYGKVHLLNDPDMQKKMLAARSISGTYRWQSDPSFVITYTGSFELDLFKTLDRNYSWKSSDIMAPSPHIYTYEYNGKQHMYLPDAFIPSLCLEIEVKDDGSAKNISAESREKDRIKDELMRSNANLFNYLKIINKDYTELLKLIREDSSDIE